MAVAALPPGEVGTCVLDKSGGLFRGSGKEIQDALRRGGLLFHPGRIRGTLPTLKR